MKKLLTIAALAVVSLSSAAYSQECGNVSIAGLNWGSASILSEIDKRVLEKGYGCTVEVIPGNTIPTFTSMVEQAQPDIISELWPNAAGIDLYNTALENKSIVEASSTPPIGGIAEGWYILPNILEEHPELTTLDAVLARPDLFPHYDDPTKGGFVTCPPGAGCQISNANLFIAFNMEAKGWQIIETGSYEAEDATISRAYDQGEAWFGYYSAPNAFIGKYNMVKLDWGVDFAGQENWNCITKPDCPSPQPSSWTASLVRTVFTQDFATRSTPEIQSYFENRAISDEIMNALLLYMSENQATPEEAAEMFFSEYNVWTQWVSADVAAKLK